ncbi:uncharacterized protein LOC119777736 [Cyprinodon tularosa]|uniref:uncharacterized protein LOC119777736 n=1 Tax=Cyprinodon tularosa TaxID=77115 RepID=UPI0018E1EC24|nr:uncharacterized protein LOC119777736 [Cyprinodon tularosa]
MSNEKGPEVVGCDASIMKNVWEIRMREIGERMRLEQERLEKSALPIINKDWANRMTAKMGKYKRVERKAKPSDSQTDENIWKSKQPLVPQAVPFGRGSGPLSRPGFQAKSFSSQTPHLKDKKGQNKSFSKLQLLLSITQTQSSTLVWGKAWKFNKSLPSPAEGQSVRSDWGQCWMFASYQPCSEEGKPWPNEHNLVDLQKYQHWRKVNRRMVESQELDLNLPTEEWQTSWKRSEKIQMDSAENDVKVSKYGLFASLVETHRHNEILSSSEWTDSWRSTKPVDQQDFSAVPNEGLLIVTVRDIKDMEDGISSEWEQCWRLLNHHTSNSSKQSAHSPEWINSWRTAAAVFNNKQSNFQDHGHGFDDHVPLRGGFHKITFASHKRQLQMFDQFEAINDWNKSWEISKNNSKPCAEIDKVLKAFPPKMDVETQRAEKTPQVNSSEEADPRYEQLRHDVIHHAKKELPKSKLLLLKYLQKIQPPSEWRESWKLITHRMRQERRRYKLDPLYPFKESEKGEDLKPSASEWKDSWNFLSLPLNQSPELWQQPWLNTTQIRVNWERHQKEISVEEFPKNGPTSERVWGESWKFSRYQNSLDVTRSKEQVGKEKLGVPCISSKHQSYAGLITDWQNAWMISETQLSHDKPSFAEWREAWQWSYHTPHWIGQRWVEESTEIRLPKRISFEGAEDKSSHSFQNKIFSQRYPKKEWASSWSAKSLSSNQPNHSGSTLQQHPIVGEYECHWGRSFRLANPMPQLDQPWIESSTNPYSYSIMWSRTNKMQNNTKSLLNKNFAPATFWANSHRFLQNTNAQVKNKSRSKELGDPKVILAKNIKIRKLLYLGTEKEKQSERKWAGCHLLGKTQPRRKKSQSSSTKLKPEDNVNKFLAEWIESWRFLVCPESIKIQKSFKPLLGWEESWKFLLPSY